MKLCLILGVLAALAPGVSATPVARPHPKPAVEVGPQPARAVQPSAPPRQLSLQERAELRRQLQQFNEQYRRQ